MILFPREMSKVQMHGNENYKSYLWVINLFLKTISLSLYANLYIYYIERERTSDACEINGRITRVTLSHCKINNVVCIALKWPIYRDIPRSLYVLYFMIVVFIYFSHVHMNFVYQMKWLMLLMNGNSLPPIFLFDGKKWTLYF